ncbi:response regulator transcription factor [Paraburkholderia sp.]|uniref:winged helix-turn-helix domain-containing protein n=1 Tax=Paraburkholderia sp. TaxID=1926495 RepID=UPI002382DEB5|nr:response regulator transcription factor [Paraburkholderia sp.]MDE1182153.1 response regulator transcription factor [Paraburkholderia sp.]
MTVRLLVVEPDQEIRDQLRAHFQQNQIEMSVLYGVTQLVSRVELECPSAILLRAEAPMLDERSAIRRLRFAGYDMPIIVRSTSNDVVDKIVAFELGVDDYIVDPVDLRELTARIRRTVQRCSHALLDAPEIRRSVTFGEFQVDFAARRLVKNGRDIALRSSEFALLKIFTSNPMRVLTRSMVNSQLGKSATQHGSLDVAVCRLRSVIEDDPSAPRLIQTLRGRGYMFVPSSDRPDATTSDHDGADVSRLHASPMNPAQLSPAMGRVDHERV